MLRTNLVDSALADPSWVMIRSSSLWFNLAIKDGGSLNRPQRTGLKESYKLQTYTIVLHNSILHRGHAECWFRSVWRSLNLRCPFCSLHTTIEPLSRLKSISIIKRPALRALLSVEEVYGLEKRSSP